MKQQQWKLPITRACVLVLQEANRPMHYLEITEQLESRGLIASQSQAVERCVYSGMSKHIRTTENRGWFVHAGRGKYALSAKGRSLEVWRGDFDWAGAITPNRAPRLDMTWPLAVTKVLRDAAKPLGIREVLARVWQKGYRPQVDGGATERSVGNLLARLSRESPERARNTIKRVAPGTYLFVE